MHLLEKKSIHILLINDPLFQPLVTPPQKKKKNKNKKKSKKLS